jgi:MOSC domain-containing protein YiiM
MKLLSINVGLPREVEWQGKPVLTSIFKAPVSGTVRLTSLNLEGDRQSDLSVHGGVNKAIYVYPFEHYSFWHRELESEGLPFGSFGENFTTEGLLEDSIHIGDRLRIGSAEFAVTQPRLPCYKLGLRFGRADMLKRFLRSRRTGFYLAVLKEGEVTAGDSIELIAGEPVLSVTDIVNLYAAKPPDRDLMRKASELHALPADWRDYFRKRLHGDSQRLEG